MRGSRSPSTSQQSPSQQSPSQDSPPLPPSPPQQPPGHSEKSLQQPEEGKHSREVQLFTIIVWDENINHEPHWKPIPISSLDFKKYCHDFFVIMKTRDFESDFDTSVIRRGRIDMIPMGNFKRMIAFCTILQTHINTDLDHADHVFADNYVRFTSNVMPIFNLTGESISFNDLIKKLTKKVVNGIKLNLKRVKTSAGGSRKLSKKRSVTYRRRSRRRNTNKIS
jgi:hypothetical protein